MCKMYSQVKPPGGGGGGWWEGYSTNVYKDLLNIYNGKHFSWLVNFVCHPWWADQWVKEKAGFSIRF